MKQILLGVFLIALLSCQKGHEAAENYSDAEASENTESNDPNSGMTISNNMDMAQNRKVIWTGNMEFQVGNVDESTKKISAISKQYGGFVSKITMSSTNYRISNVMVIRVASSKFDSLMSAIKGESIFLKNIEVNSTDVSEEFVDIQSRLQTKKEVRERYIAILKNKTGSIKDVLEAEEAIRKITEEIEAKEGRLRYLNDQVNFSTLTINLFQEVEYKKEPTIYEKPFFKKFLEGLKNGWNMITNILLGLVNIWPIVLILGLILWKRKWLVAKWRK